MNAIRIHEYGGPEQLRFEDVPDPQASEGQVLVRVHAASDKGWYSGTSIDSQDTLAFSTRSGVRPMNEVYPLERVAEAYDRMMSGKARFRVGLATGC